MTKPIEYWYRFEDRTTVALLDDNGKPTGSERINIDLYKYKVMRHTKKGVWIEFGFSKDRFVLKDARKRFACPTVEEAEQSFIARKERQLSILRIQMSKVNYVLAEARTVMNVLSSKSAVL